MWQPIQHTRHECQRHNGVRLMDSIQFVNGLNTVHVWRPACPKDGSRDEIPWQVLKVKPTEALAETPKPDAAV